MTANWGIGAPSFFPPTWFWRRTGSGPLQKRYQQGRIDPKEVAGVRIICHFVSSGLDARGDIRRDLVGEQVDDSDNAAAVTDVELIAIWQYEQPIRARDIVLVGAIRGNETSEPQDEGVLLPVRKVHHMDTIVDTVREVIGAVIDSALVHAGRILRRPRHAICRLVGVGKHPTGSSEGHSKG
ncbi:hypothetical protein N7486_003566 [Penicillium sp. IBT 16267x]|nr:hypothetical protein N7486_003566 [Penicillium sp. IBT 16267x]